MISGRLISDELDLGNPGPVRDAAPASDSSRLLAELLRIREVSRQTSADSVDGQVSRILLRALLALMSYRDAKAVQHARNVAMISTGVAQFLGWEGSPLRRLEVASLLHDIGKIGIPDNVLYKPGQLNEDERDLMALHSRIAVDFLQAVHVDPAVQSIIARASQKLSDPVSASEAGVPEVDLGARILAVADAYESMSTPQVFRAAMEHDEIVATLNRSAGLQFDANVVSALVRWCDQQGPPCRLVDDESSASFSTAGNDGIPEQFGTASSLGSVFSQLYLLENLYDAFYLVDLESKIAVWSPGCEELLGYTSAEMTQQTWTPELIPHTDLRGDQPLEQSEVPLLVTRRSLHASLTNVRLLHKEGQWVAAELQSMPLVGPDGELLGVAQVLKGAEAEPRKSKSYRELEVKATHDSLTQVANRGEIERKIREAFKEAEAAGERLPYSVIFLDIDRFKAINDTYGHAVGDQVLIEFARVLKSETYSGETIGRYGGEEFVVLCPETDLEQARRRADRLRLAIAKHHMSDIGGLQVTASFGVTERETVDTVETLLSRADHALYLSKQRGRDCVNVITSSDLKEPEPETPAAARQDLAEGVFEDSFVACTGADMIVLKLSGFVLEYGARAIKASGDAAVLRLGRKPLLGLGGGDPERLPVDVQLWFQELPRPLRSSSSRVRVHVRVTPLGRRVKPHVLQLRARQIFFGLKAFFAGE